MDRIAHDWDPMHDPVTGQDTPPDPPAFLHIYACTNCRTIAASTTRAMADRIKCVMCLRWMTYRHSDRITTDGQRAIATIGLVYNPWIERGPLKCTACRALTPRKDLIDRGPLGRFCSEACVTVGEIRHREYLERVAAEQEAERLKTRPWLKDGAQ